MSRFSDACRQPFSNGTERDCWTEHWCDFCVHDHAVHVDAPGGSGPCDLMLYVLLDGEMPWPEAWLPEPDDGRHFLPSRLVCLQFEACGSGDCTGDPGESDRTGRVAEVMEHWRTAV